MFLAIIVTAGIVSGVSAQSLAPAQPRASDTGPSGGVSPLETANCTDPTGGRCPDNGADENGGGLVVFLPPLLAGLLDGVRPGRNNGGKGGDTDIGAPGDSGRSPGNTGPTPPRVDGSEGSGGPVPPRVGGTQAERLGAPLPPVRPQENDVAALADPDLPAPLPPLPNVPPRAVTGAFVPNQVLVTIDGDAALAAAIAATNNLNVLSTRSSVLLDATVANYGIPDGRSVGQVLGQLEADGRTLQSVPNHIFGLQQSGAFPQYAFERIALTSEEADGGNVRVAVIDSAIDEEHPALAGAVVASHDALPDIPVADRRHGTSIVGLIAADGNIRGTAPGAAIFHSRAFENGQSTMEAILRSLDWATESEVNIVNMSFAGRRNALMEQACDTARRFGIVLVAAAGNNGPGAPFAFPAAYESVLAITATDYANGIMEAANRGAYIFIAAPGVEVVAPVPGGTDFLSGTSMATAVVSGMIANLIREDANRDPDWIESALATTAVDLGPVGRDNDFGFGLVSFAAARAGGPQAVE